MASALACNVVVDAQASVAVDAGSVLYAPPNSLLTFTLASLPVIDSSTGSVVVDLPALALGQSVRVKHDEDTSLATNTVTVNGPVGVNIAEPVPNNGTFAASYVFGGVGGGAEQARGSDFTWRNAGSAGGYVLE